MQALWFRGKAQIERVLLHVKLQPCLGHQRKPVRSDCSCGRQSGVHVGALKPPRGVFPFLEYKSQAGPLDR